MSGFIAMSRAALDHPLLQDGERFRAWFWLVAKACWKPTKFDVGGSLVTLDRGQICVSVRQLAEAWGWSKSSVDRFLSRLKSETMIGTDAGTGRLVITICNYDKYQSAEDEAGTGTGTPPGDATPPNATRTQPDQKPGQQRDTSNPQKTIDFEDGDEGRRDSSGTAAGQQRDTKEQGNKITREDNTPPTPPIGSGEQELVDRIRDKDWPEIPDWVPAVPWNGFLDMRKRKKAWPTAYAVKLLLRKLDRFRSSGCDPGAVLDQSTVNHWTDIYQIKEKGNGSRTNTQPSQRENPDGFMRSVDRELGIGAAR